MTRYERNVYEPDDQICVFDGSDDEEDAEGSRLLLLIVLALLVLAMYAGVVWLAYTQGVARGRTETPVLTAAAAAAKAKSPGAGFKIYEQPAPADDQSDAAQAPVSTRAAVSQSSVPPPQQATAAPPPPAAFKPSLPAQPAPAASKPAAAAGPPVSRTASLAKSGPATATPKRLGSLVPAAPVPAAPAASPAHAGLAAAPAPHLSRRAPMRSRSGLTNRPRMQAQPGAPTRPNMRRCLQDMHRTCSVPIWPTRVPGTGCASRGFPARTLRKRCAIGSRLTAAVVSWPSSAGKTRNGDGMRSRAIYGCAGTHLTAWEREFFRGASPWGFILFSRNLESPKQVRTLVAHLRECVDDPKAPVLIDQEGGRVARLGPPGWHARPPAARFGAVYAADPERAREATYLNARLIAHDLAGLGINVDCVPVLDVPSPGADKVIGDRAFAADPATVIDLGRAQIEGLMEGGVLPVMKHIPGHGRAEADSHHALPRVDADAEELSATDFVTFRSLNQCPIAMTAHVVYAAIDAGRPATTSAKVIRDVIRGEIGFEGLLISDDLSMKALDGPISVRAKAALFAGCDIVLHCNGDLEEMQEVALEAKPLEGVVQRRADHALAHSE